MVPIRTRIMMEEQRAAGQMGGAFGPWMDVFWSLATPVVIRLVRALEREVVHREEAG